MVENGSEYYGGEGPNSPPQCANRRAAKPANDGLVHHMQKALDKMNLQLHHVIRDITDLTGLAIADAILARERDLHRLAKLRHECSKASEDVIAKSLVGDYRAQHLFRYGWSLVAYRSYLQLIADCDQETGHSLDQFKAPPESRSAPESRADRKAKPLSNNSVLRRELQGPARNSRNPGGNRPVAVREHIASRWGGDQAHSQASRSEFLFTRRSKRASS